MHVLRKIAQLGSAPSIKIQVMDRARGHLVDEVVCAEDLMRVFYGTQFGLRLVTKLFVFKWLSFFGGLYYDTRLSRRKIPSFIRQMQLDLSECEKAADEYTTFNEFFARRLKPGARHIAEDPHGWVSPGDGRLLVFPHIHEETLTYVKWAPIRLMDLLHNNRELVDRYRGGACGVLRLCPSDYHRFHFPATGMVGPTTAVPGLLHSVSPFVLEQKTPVFAVNKRTICTLDTEDFGPVLLMEVGAMGVGGIVQSTQPHSWVQKGDEKGYFKYGGSTTIFFLPPDTIKFDDDLVKNSSEGVETLVRMGEVIGRLR